ncbi:MAG: glycoside hydrolase family 38 C-terminal domain-containing protein, partial [Victivallales bacterium]
MKDKLEIKQIIPTVFLKKGRTGLLQLVKICTMADKGHASVLLEVKTEKAENEILLESVPAGESVHEIFIDEIKSATKVDFILKTCGEAVDFKSIHWTPPKHWVVHVVQISHHDLGYTDLPSSVLTAHDRWLDNAIAMMNETDEFPDDAKFRIVVEQTWSLDHFLENAPERTVTKVMGHIRSGRMEVTALFGNMTTEICGHEEMIRTLYHAFNLRRAYGIPVISAEHNDITGVSWGLCRVLADAGIKIFCAGIPLYYNWGGSDLKLQSFWDEKEIFPHGGPGAFWWKSPSGKKLLFWCNNSGCGGDFHAGLPLLAEQLQRFAERNYPYSVLRWPVQGGARDNSPYILEYARTIKEWNEKWVYPHLICSTNAKFYEDFIKEVPSDLPVFSGELPGQDYPVGATSTAAPTASNRNNHISLTTAEKMASMAALLTDYRYQNEELSAAYKDILCYDEHVWGHHFPCGPAMKASEYEKAVHAYRAAALAHDVINKAIAKIADNVKLDEEGLHLVVFNPVSYAKTGAVHAPLREIDNCGSTMYAVPSEEDPAGTGYLRGVLLCNRWHANPDIDLVDGKFELIDVSTGEKVPFQIIEVESAMDTIPYAAERLGIGSGTKRYGFFEKPIGLKRDLCFIARDMPAYGYKTYRLKPSVDLRIYSGNLKSGEWFIENEFYNIEVDRVTGAITSIFDKMAGREIVDPDCFHGFNRFIVRRPDSGGEYHMDRADVKIRLDGPVCISLDIAGSAYGHPVVRQTISLYAGIKQIYVNSRILKDATPLLDAHLAFPFKMDNPKFRYEGVLSVMNPIEDYLPGAYSDRIAVQNWVKVT